VREGSLGALAPFRVPVRSAELLGKAARGGSVFCSVRYGGYVAWKLWPRWKPYIDGRLVLRTRAQFAEYLDAVDHPEHFDALQERHGFSAVLLPTAYPERYLGLLAYLVGHPNWRLAYTDGSEMLLLPAGQDRAATPGVDHVREEIDRHYAGAERLAARHNFARFLLATNRPAEARRVVFGLEDGTSRSLEARSYYMEGDLDRAERVAARVLADDAEDTSSLNLVAAIAIDRGDTEAALDHLARVLDIDPYNVQGNELLRRLEADGVP
jgi:tetratricopeptide (TPR) repeat protein